MSLSTVMSETDRLDHPISVRLPEVLTARLDKFLKESPAGMYSSEGHVIRCAIMFFLSKKEAEQDGQKN